MTDHPSNPPSQECPLCKHPPHVSRCGQLLPPWRGKSYGCDCRTSEGARPTKREELTLEQIKAASDLLMPNKSYMNSDAFGRVVMAVAAALAAQEARHQEQREVDAAAIRLSLGMLATEEARHKAALDAMRDERDTWAGVAGRQGAEAEINRQRAEEERRLRVLTALREGEAESKLRQERDRCLGIVHSYGVGYPLGDIAAAIRSGQAQPPAEMAMGGSYEVALAAAFEAVKVLADYPPEQETPKPPPFRPHVFDSHEKCINCEMALTTVFMLGDCDPGCGPASAPPAHGGQE